jgi:phage terminase large subunit-like protein
MNAEAKLLKLVTELRESQKRHRLAVEYGRPWSPTNPGPYPWQIDFHNAGATNMERAVIAANQTGKSTAGAAETAMHLTGEYPEWWQGRRFDAPTDGICCAPTNETLRDTVQDQLFGKVDFETNEAKDLPGTGWVPKNAIGDFGFRQCGVNNVLDFVRVRHKSGGWSQVTFRTYEQGYVKVQGVTRDFVWLDEEPDDHQFFTEALMRVLVKNGLIYMTRTPLFGASTTILHFLDGGPGIWSRTVTWDDAPHLDEDTKQRMLLSLPEHERDVRSRGIPLLGSGAVYAVPPDRYVVEPIPLPSHWARIAGTDFGIDHHAATVWCAHDRDTDTVYVYDCYKAKGQTAAYHGAAIRERGAWIPVAWPHDGMHRDKGGGEVLSEQYRNAGANMNGRSARYDEDKGGAQSREPITGVILERLRTGRLKVFSTCRELLDELRLLHRKDGVIVPERDDLESALRYAMIDLRLAVTPAEGDPTARRRQRQANSDREYDPFAMLRT